MFDLDVRNGFADGEEIEEDIPEVPEFDLRSAPEIERKKVIHQFINPDGEVTGEIRLDLGADGVYLQFDCDCLDALPYCKAQCCALVGTTVDFEELQQFRYPVEFDSRVNGFILRRDADGYCTCLDRRSRRCGIYEARPNTCQNFHCTRGPDMRGWKLANRVHRQSEGV